MFGWKKFLDARHIPYREGGRHELLVHCPFCGSNDPSQHLSISLRNRGWRCLRISTHKGKSYTRLLCNLIGCSEETARDMLGEARPVLPAADTFAATWRKQLGLNTSVDTRPTKISLPAEVKSLAHSSGTLAKMFWRELRRRGYSSIEAGWAANTYRLQYAITGFWSYRLLIPIYNSSNELQTWTARSVLPDAEIRYLTLSADQSVQSPTNLVLSLDFLWRVPKPDVLVITEGPFDAMAVTTLGHAYGIWGTCLFGVQVSDAQACLLDDLARKFSQVRLLVDPDARMKVLGFRDRLPRGCRVVDLGNELEDPGSLPSLQEGAADYLRELVA